MVKEALIKIRTSIKLIILISIGMFLIIGVIAFLYKPIYSVTIDGKLVGYCSEKSKLQDEITNYIENGEGNNVAFVQVENMPEYKLCLLKKGIVTNDDEILNLIKESGISYYKYYAILLNDEENLYVADFETAEAVVQGLKDRNSNNIDDISVLEKYETEIKDFVSTDDAITCLYVEKPVEVVQEKKTYISTVSTSTKISSNYVSTGISFIKPITGTITSRFGESSRLRSSKHTGLDIAAPTGTKIAVAADGEVVFSGTKGSYGKLVVISHNNNVQTYYGHCSALYVSVGEKVSQGQTIAAVGSTGNSTGPHLHFEVRVDGISYNPQNYIY